MATRFRHGKTRTLTHLAGQKANAKRLYGIALAMVILCTVLPLLMLTMIIFLLETDPEERRILFFVIPPWFLALLIGTTISMLIRRKIYRSFCGIESGETDALSVTVRRVRLIYYEGSKHEPHIQGIAIRTTDKHTYHYIVPKGQPFPFHYKTVIKRALQGQTVTLYSYRGTHVLATLPQID